jgi:ribosomal protein L7/L12
MRIRIFRAFASNNSGSYTLVGSFTSPGAAKAVAETLRVACAEHQEWHASDAEAASDAPLDAFARVHGLHESAPGRSDWPSYGPPPEVIAVGHQVLIHAPYTVSMPRLFGEFLYTQGGRVDLELNHSHERLAVEFNFLVRGVQWDSPARKERLAAVEQALAPLLPALTNTKGPEERSAVVPVFHQGPWGRKLLTAVFADVVEGVRVVSQTAEKLGIDVRVRIVECIEGLADPLAPLRAGGTPWGRSRVILWAVCDDRIRAMKAICEVTGSAVDEAKALLEALPNEILVDVDHAFAERAAEALREAGCDAEALWGARR